MIDRFQKFFKLYRAPIFSGILIGTTYIPFPPWALAFCYMPLWYFALRKTSFGKQIFIGAWWTQFILTLIGFHWISFVSHSYGYFPWPVAIIVLLLFAAAVHLYIPLSLWLGHWLRQKFSLSEGATLITWALLLVLGEIFWPSIFRWNLGYTLLWIHSPWAQWADVIGFQGLSAAVYLINAALLWAFLQKSKGGKRAVVAGISSLLVLFYFAGQTRQEKWQSSDAELKTLIVQANIANFEKYQAERGAGYQQEIMDQFYSLTRDALNQHPDTDLVLWPETAFPEFLDDHAKHRFYPAQLRSFVQSINKPLILGAYSKDGPEVRRRKDYNALFLFNERGELTPPPYHKTQLLIFGEYAPLVEEFPILAKYNPGGEGFGRGTGPTLMQIGDIKLGPQICYESLDPQFSAQSTLLGSQILINATNDSWFGPRGEPFQHLYMTLARAIENRRPLIRSTNTGISSAILADGTILELSPIDQKWYGLYTIHYQKNPEITFYTKYGSWLWLVISFLLALTIFLGRNRARIERPRLD